MDSIINLSNAYSSAFAVVGVGFCSFKFLKLILYVFRAIKSFMLAPLFNLGVHPLKLGSWAVVTGSTDGIGKSYAMALAKKGVNIVLVSRTASKLAAVADEIAAATNVQTKCITADFSGGAEIYPAIEEELEGIDVGILVNNVGISYEYPEYFHEVPNREQTFARMLHINLFSVTFMTSMLLPKMVAKRKGAVVNIGSAACFGFPLYAVYAASKAYVHSFSQNLAVEYENSGIIIQSVYPHVVSTKMSRVRPSFLIPPAQKYASSALSTLGVELETTGYFSHWLEGAVFHGLLPTWALMKIMFLMFKKVRTRALKRMAAKKE